MENDISKNSLIGASSADTLINISAIIKLLKYLNFSNDINDDAEYGLFLVYTAVQNALEYEVKKIDLRKT